MSITFPNETPSIGRRVTPSLESELALRRQMEAVAAELRALPPGGEVPEDYALTRWLGRRAGRGADV
jgi:predicted dithiol-disulfide oxidoreductase (DUF899 family)